MMSNHVAMTTLAYDIAVAAYPVIVKQLCHQIDIDDNDDDNDDIVLVDV